MKLTKIKKINTIKKQAFDITVAKNHNFFANGHLIHNSGYRGEYGVILYNSNLEQKDSNIIDVKKGDKIAQLVFHKVETNFDVEISEQVSETERGEGGFGSTDKK